MSQYIPVFIIPIERDKVPPNLNGWEAAIELVNDRLAQWETCGAWLATSRNWWLQHAVHLICEGLGIQGLEFADEEVAYLDGAALVTAADALDRVMQETKNGIPYLGPDVDDLGTIRFLRYEGFGPKGKLLPPELIRQAFDESQPAREVDDPDVRSRYEVVVIFFTFLKSLRQAIKETLDQDKGLLYIQPQP